LSLVIYSDMQDELLPLTVPISMAPPGV